MKETNITRLFKKGFRNKFEKHRLVSLTSIMCKLERLIKTHGLPADVVYIDFQKAFDKVPYQRL